MKETIFPILAVALVLSSCQSTTVSEVLMVSTNAEEVKKVIDQKNDQLEILYKTRQIDSALARVLARSRNNSFRTIYLKVAAVRSPYAETLGQFAKFAKTVPRFSE